MLSAVNGGRLERLAPIQYPRVERVEESSPRVLAAIESHPVYEQALAFLRDRELHDLLEATWYSWGDVVDTKTDKAIPFPGLVIKEPLKPATFVSGFAQWFFTEEPSAHLHASPRGWHEKRSDVIGPDGRPLPYKEQWAVRAYLQTIGGKEAGFRRKSPRVNVSDFGQVTEYPDDIICRYIYSRNPLAGDPDAGSYIQMNTPPHASQKVELTIRPEFIYSENGIAYPQMYLSEQFYAPGFFGWKPDVQRPRARSFLLTPETMKDLLARTVNQRGIGPMRLAI